MRTVTFEDVYADLVANGLWCAGCGREATLAEAGRWAADLTAEFADMGPGDVEPGWSCEGCGRDEGGAAV